MAKSIRHDYCVSAAFGGGGAAAAAAGLHGVAQIGEELHVVQVI